MEENRVYWWTDGNFAVKGSEILNCLNNSLAVDDIMAKGDAAV